MKRRRGGGGGGGIGEGGRIGDGEGGKRMSKKTGGRRPCITHNASNPRYLFVDDGVEDDPGETIVLEWGELGGLMEDEHRGHLRC